MHFRYSILIGHGMEDFIVCKRHGIEEMKCPGKS